MIERHNPKTLVNNLVVDAKALLNDNIALAKAELVPTAKNAGVGGGMFGAAGYLGANGVSLLFMAGGFAFALLLAHLTHWGPLASLALGFVIMALILFAIAGILALMGKKKFEQVGPPKQTIAEAKNTVQTLKQSVTNGVNEVEADIRDRKSLSQAKKAAKDMEKSSYTTTVTTTAPATGTGGATRADLAR